MKILQKLSKLLTMREIKFRGRKFNGEWLYGDLVHNVGVGASTALIFPEEAHDSWDRYIILTDTIGQFTGLHDKNGKEIYEGDIIESDGYSGARHYVGYRKEEAMFVAYIIGTTPQDYCSVFQHWIDDYEKKVIGNIHDNPELLNE